MPVFCALGAETTRVSMFYLDTQLCAAYWGLLLLIFLFVRFIVPVIDAPEVDASV
jgi:hypothetical protein